MKVTACDSMNSVNRPSLAFRTSESVAIHTDQEELNNNRSQTNTIQDSAFEQIDFEDLHDVAGTGSLVQCASVSSLASCRFRNKLIANLPVPSYYSNSQLLLANKTQETNTSVSQKTTQQTTGLDTQESYLQESTKNEELRNAALVKNEETGKSNIEVHRDEQYVNIPSLIKAQIYRQLYPIVQSTVEAYATTLGQRHIFTTEAKNKLEEMSKFINETSDVETETTGV